MRLNLCLSLIAALLFSGPAMAGTVSANGGQVAWQPTQCAALPDAPKPITTRASLHGTADDVNRRVRAYNEYAQKVQAYIDCVSKEAQADAKSLSDSIVASAQQNIDAAQKSADDSAVTMQINKQ